MCPKTPEAYTDMELAWRTRQSCDTTDFTSFPPKQKFHGSIGKQTQLIAPFSKPLTQKISQKINKQQKDKGLSFVLRGPAPAPASSRREHQPCATGMSQLGNPESSHCRKGWTVTGAPVSLQPQNAVLPFPN